MTFDYFPAFEYDEAQIPPVLLRHTVAGGFRSQYAGRYGNHATDRQILEARYGYLPIGATVHEFDWERQENGPLTIRLKQEGDY